MKLVYVLIALFFIVLLSCHRPHTTIIVNDNNHYTKIEFAGNITFSADRTGIAQMSRRAYFTCNEDGEKLTVERDFHGQIIYKLHHNRTTYPDAEEQSILTKAVGIVMHQQKGPVHGLSGL